MKEKIKELAKKDGLYLLTGLGLFIVTLLIATVTYNNSTQDYMLHLPNQSLYVQWTPVQNSVIKGVQARYFLPILMLMAIILNNNKLVIEGKLSYRYILLFLLFFNLNVLTSTLYTYIYATVIDYYIK